MLSVRVQFITAVSVCFQLSVAAPPYIPIMSKITRQRIDNDLSEKERIT